MIDYGQISPPQGVITFPDYAVFGTPLQPDQIVETIFIQGSNITTGVVVGSVDSPQ